MQDECDNTGDFIQLQNVQPQTLLPDQGESQSEKILPRPADILHFEYDDEDEEGAGECPSGLESQESLGLSETDGGCSSASCPEAEPGPTSASSKKLVTIHKLLPPTAAFLAPVKFKDTLYYGMSVNVSQMKEAGGEKSEVKVDIKSKYPEKFLKNWMSRKNQNPLQTRVTVRQLKELIINHKTQCPTEEKTADVDEQTEKSGGQSGGNGDVGSSEVDSADTETPPSSSSPQVQKNNGFLDAIMKMSGLNVLPSPNPVPPPRLEPRKPHSNSSVILPVEKKKSGHKKKTTTTNKKSKAPRKKLVTLNEKLIIFQIGSFRVDDSEALLRLRIHFKQECMVYEVQTKQYPIKDTLEDGGNPVIGDPIQLFTTIVFRFDQIQAIHFKEQEMLVRLNSAPSHANGAMDVEPGDVCPIPKGYDITEGHSQDCLIHYVKFSRPMGSRVQQALLNWEGGVGFLSLMVGEMELLNAPAPPPPPPPPPPSPAPLLYPAEELLGDVPMEGELIQIMDEEEGVGVIVVDEEDETDNVIVNDGGVEVWAPGNSLEPGRL